MAMPQSIPWTLEGLDRLPDDGNRYEVLDGELLVTPAPSDVHQEIVAWLSDRLVPFVSANKLGRVYHPRSVIVVDGSQLEPDLMVRPIAPRRGWEHAPLPILVVEVLSATTKQRDLSDKRAFYMQHGIDEYWVIDHHSRSVMRVTADSQEVLTSVLMWAPAGVAKALEIDLVALFDETRGGE